MTTNYVKAALQGRGRRGNAHLRRQPCDAPSASDDYASAFSVAEVTEAQRLMEDEMNRTGDLTAIVYGETEVPRGVGTMPGLARPMAALSVRRRGARPRELPRSARRPVAT